MRVTLAESTLTRQAGRFVWLELNFDKPENKAFLVRHDVAYTPALFVLDPVDERATASHFGALTLPELNRFLDRGARGAREAAATPADSALAQGDALLGLGRLADATAAYRHALHVAPPHWGQRPHAVAQLTWTLMTDGESEACARIAVGEAPPMARGAEFVRVVLAGLSSGNQGGSATWARGARTTLTPLAAEAAALDGAGREARFELYQQLMYSGAIQGDTTAVTRWGERWLGEIEAITPRSDDERTALDVARVDAVSELGTPERAVAALEASERAMPGNYNASLRLAQVLVQAGRFDDGLAACDRGLTKVDGPIGRTWLLQTKAQAYMGKDDHARALRVLEEAQRAAQEINTSKNRENNLRRIARMMAEADKSAN